MNSKTGDAHIYVVSDRMRDATGELLVDVTDAQGKVLLLLLLRSSGTEAIPAGTSRLARTLKLSHLLETHGAGNILVWPAVRIGAKTVASSLLFFNRPLDFRLPNPHISSTIGMADGNFTVRLESNKPAPWTWVHLGQTDAKYSDNFFHLWPGTAQVVHVRPSQPLTMAQFQKQLKIRSITDIAPGMRA